MNVRAALAGLFGVSASKPAGNVPGYPDTILHNPYALDRLAWDYPKAMRRVGIVRSCVLRIANDLAQMPVVFERQSGADWVPLPRTDGNIVDVWARANDRQASFELVRDLHAHHKASGNAFLVAETFGTKKVMELWLMPPQLVRIVPGARRSDERYIFDRGGKPENVDAKYVIHFRGYNPDFEPNGASDLESVEFQYSTRYDIGRLMQLFVINGGTPAGFFKVVGQDGKTSPTALQEPDRINLQRQIDRLFNGIRNAFKPKLMSSVDWARTGLTPDEMKLIEIATLSDGDVCRALGVPPWMVGIKETAGKLGDSGGAAAQDRGIYITNTLLPEVAMRDGVLTERLCPMFELGIRARTDLSGVRELLAPFINTAQQTVALTGRPVVTVNELRKMFGLPPSADPEADTLQAPASAAGLGGIFGPSPAGPEPAAATTEPAPAPVAAAKARRMIDGDPARDRARARADANLARYTRRAARLFHGFLQDQLAGIVAQVEAQGVRARANGKRAFDAEDLQPDPNDQAALEALLRQLVQDRGEEVLAELALQLQIDVNSARASAFVQRNAQRALALINESTKAALREQIATSLAAQETTSQLVERIRSMPEFGQARALTIARTETASAYNFAAMDAYEQSGIVDGMEWLSARDSHVRPTHSIADGQVVSVGMSFDVGGAALMYPGDPGGPPEETINCRCTTLPVVNERARARRTFAQVTLPRLLGAGKKEPVT